MTQPCFWLRFGIHFLGEGRGGEWLIHRISYGALGSGDLLGLALKNARLLAQNSSLLAGAQDVTTIGTRR